MRPIPLSVLALAAALLALIPASMAACYAAPPLRLVDKPSFLPLIPRPRAAVRHAGYVVHVYYYHPALDAEPYFSYMHMPWGVVSAAEERCGTADMETDRGRLLESIAELLVGRGRTMLSPMVCWSEGIVAVGVYRGRMTEELQELQDALMPYACDMWRLGIKVEAYPVDYGFVVGVLNATMAGYAEKLDQILRPRGMNLLPCSGLSENPLTNAPLLRINASIYTEIASSRPGVAARIAQEAAENIAEALAAVGFPVKHVDVELVLFAGSMKEPVLPENMHGAKPAACAVAPACTCRCRPPPRSHGHREAGMRVEALIMATLLAASTLMAACLYSRAGVQ